MNLLGQLEKIDKHDETVAMPTARNYSPEETTESQRRNEAENNAYGKQSRNTRLPPAGRSGNSNQTSGGAMKTVTLLPGEELSHHSPHIQSRLLHNFNQARQTLRKATKQAKPVQIHPVQHLEMTP